MESSGVPSFYFTDEDTEDKPSRYLMMHDKLLPNLVAWNNNFVIARDVVSHALGQGSAG